jgi:metal-responsive CopG/Arc/MetJ family transcriptional regulator
MQTTIYYSDEDAYLLKQVDAKGRRERKSRSAVILSVLEQYFEAEKKLGEILIDLGVVTHADLAKGLELQQTRFTDKLLGDILLEEEIVTPEAVERALLIQGRGRQTDASEA